MQVVRLEYLKISGSFIQKPVSQVTMITRSNTRWNSAWVDPLSLFDTVLSLIFFYSLKAGLTSPFAPAGNSDS